MQSPGGHQHNYGPDNVQNNYFGPSETRWAGPAFAVPPLTGREVARPGLLGSVTAAVLGIRGGGPVGMTTRVAGASGGGGFGKSTLARLVAYEHDVREYFRDGIVWVTMGQDAQGSVIADKVNNLTELFTGVKPALTDPLAAGARLAELLADRHVLVIADDVWTRSQLEPFLTVPSSGQSGPVVLVTTRIRNVLSDPASAVYVDAMAGDEAEELLTAELTGAPSAVVRQLLELTGRWPVLLGLVNGAARADVRKGLAVGEALAGLADQLADEGPDALRLDDDASRGRAVSTVMRASLRRLSKDGRRRYRELAVFGAATDIPLPVLERYWRRNPAQIRRFCRDLDNLNLLAEYRLDSSSPRLRLHDVIRSWLRHDAAEHLRELHSQLVDAHRALVPRIKGRSQWQNLPVTGPEPVIRYLWESLPVHMQAANQGDELVDLLSEPGWLLGKLAVAGPAALEADLGLVDDPVCRALGQVVRQSGHLLTPLEPKGSLAATLASRLPEDPRLARVRDQLIETIPGPYLHPVGPMPDLAHPNLRRILAGHDGQVIALALAPDGTWLASAGQDGEVRVWDPATGTLRCTLGRHTSWITALATAPDGTWLASAGQDGEVRVWDPATGTLRCTLGRHTSWITALATAPDGTWLASAGQDGEVRVWDPATRALRHTFTDQIDTVTALAVACDGTWLASAGHDGTMRIWDPAAGSLRHTFTDHIGTVTALAVACDGTWLASADTDDIDGLVRVRESVTGAVRHTLTGHIGGVAALAVAPDGTWFASAGHDGTVRVWEPATGAESHTFTGHFGGVAALAVAPDGTWFASAGHDGTVRVWEPATRAVLHTFTGHTGTVAALAVAPDGTWLASAGHDGTVRVWEPALRTITTQSLTRHTGAVTALAAPRHGTWIAFAGHDGTISIAAQDSGMLRHSLADHTGAVMALAAPPRGEWLAFADADDTLRFWDPGGTGVQRHTLTGHTRTVTGMVAIAALPRASGLDSVSRGLDGIFGWLVSADADGTVLITDPDRGSQHRAITGASHAGSTMVVGGPSPVTRLAFADDGVSLRDPDAGRRYRRIPPEPGDRDHLRWPQPGNPVTWLACAGPDGTVQVWDLVQGILLHILTGHIGTVTALAVAHDSNWLASAGNDGTVRIWEPATGIRRRVLYGHSGGVTALAVAPDGTWLASAGHDGTVRIWEPTRGKPIGELTGHTGTVAALAAEPDGPWLASAGHDGTVRIWHPRTTAAITALRIDSPLSLLDWTDAVLVAAGMRGSYILGSSSRRPVPMPLDTAGPRGALPDAAAALLQTLQVPRAVHDDGAGRGR